MAKLKFVFNSIAYGLAAALLIIAFTPELRSNLGLNKLNVMNPNAMSFAHAVQQAAPAVVNIYSVVIKSDGYNQSQQLNDLGSGVIMTSKGHILTNYHVVDNAELIRVVLQDGRQFNAQVLGLDKVTDLALLKIDATNLPQIPQQENLEAQVGDIVLAIGNPLNYGQTITQGIISATGKKGLTDSLADHSAFIQMDAAINLGNSGGALVNSQGMLVGINTAAAPQGIQGIFFAIPYKLAKTVMDKLLADGEVSRGYLGVTGQAVNQAGAPVSSTVESIAGIRITSVDPLGPAWSGGIKVNDIILSISGEQVASPQELSRYIESTKPGTKLELILSREGSLIRTTLTVAKLDVGNY